MGGWRYFSGNPKVGDGWWWEEEGNPNVGGSGKSRQVATLHPGTPPAKREGLLPNDHFFLSHYKPNMRQIEHLKISKSTRLFSNAKYQPDQVNWVDSRLSIFEILTHRYHQTHNAHRIHRAYQIQKAHQTHRAHQSRAP